MAVLAGHVRGLFFVDYESVRHSALLGVSYLVTGFGHQAVVVFFVLSGFFIGSSVSATTNDGSWSWSRFALRRLTRLYVVILPALLMTAVWDFGGMSLWGTSGVYGGDVQAPSLTLPIVRETLTLPVLAGNVAFLQELVVPSFGSNGPLWSLSYEAWSYATFPLLFRAVCGSERAWVRACIAGLGVAILVVAGSLFRFYFCVWCIGALIAVVWSRRPFPRIGPVLGTLAACAFLLALFIGRLRLLGSRSGEDLSLGIATGAFVAARLARYASPNAEGTPSRARVRYARLGDVLAGFSFTLYATHYPVVAFFQAWLVGRERWVPSAAHAAIATLFGLGVAALYSYPVSRLTEANTDRVRKWIERVARRVSPAFGGAA